MQPDLIVLDYRLGLYKDKLKASDALLVIEVDPSARHDRKVKPPICTAAGIPQYWIADINRESIRGVLRFC